MGKIINKLLEINEYFRRQKIFFLRLSKLTLSELNSQIVYLTSLSLQIQIELFLPSIEQLDLIGVKLFQLKLDFNPNIQLTVLIQN